MIFAIGEFDACAAVVAFSCRVGFGIHTQWLVSSNVTISA